MCGTFGHCRGRKIPRREKGKGLGPHRRAPVLSMRRPVHKVRLLALGIMQQKLHGARGNQIPFPEDMYFSSQYLQR